MRIEPTLEFTIDKATDGAVARFVQMLYKLYQQLALAINGQLTFGDGISIDNVNGFWSNLTAPGTPNTDFTITHGLGRVPAGYLVMEKDRACDVYTGSVAPTINQITLRATVASAVLRIFVLMLLIYLPLKAQTTVNLTVSDTPDGQTWNNGTWFTKLQVSGTPGNPPVITSGGGSLANQSGVLTGTGTASIILPANANINPLGTSWSITVCPQASTSACFSQLFTVQVSSPQALTVNPPSVRIPSLPAVQAYSSTEISGAPLGGEYFDLTLNASRICNTVVGALCTAWSSASSSPFSYTGLVDGKDFLVSDLAHGQIITDASWSNASSTINSAGMAQWTTALIGDVVFGTQSCRTFAFGPATGIDTIGVVVPLGTILTVPSATQLTVSTTTTQAVVSGGCVVIGQRQDTGMAGITAAVNNNTFSCQTVKLPAGIFLISLIPGFLSSQPAACAKNGLVEGGEFGAAGGFLVTGAGQNSTVFAIVPDLLPTACVNGAGNSCFVIPTGGSWRDFRITGSGNGMSARSDGTKKAVEVDSYGAMRDITLDQWGDGDTGFVGLDIENSGGVNWFLEDTLDTFGNVGVVDNSTGTTVVRNWLVQNICGSTVYNHSGSGSIYSEGLFFIQNYPNTVCSAPNTNRTILTMNGGQFFSSNDTIKGTFGNTANSNGILIASGVPVYLNNNSSVSVTGTGSFAVQVLSGGAFVMRNGSLISNPGGTTLLNASGAASYDLGGLINGAWGTNNVISNSGKFLGSSSIQGSQLATGNIALTSGWGASTVASVQAGSDGHSGKFTITGAAGSAGPVLTLTFPFAYPTAPAACTLFETGANDLASLTSVVTTSTSTTTAVFTFVGTPVAVTYVFQYQCGP